MAEQHPQRDQSRIDRTWAIGQSAFWWLAAAAGAALLVAGLYMKGDYAPVLIIAGGVGAIVSASLAVAAILEGIESSKTIKK